MENLSPSIDVEVATFEPAEELGKTAISFVSFDSEENDYMPLLADEQLDYIKSLGRSDLTVKDQVIYWEGMLQQSKHFLWMDFIFRALVYVTFPFCLSGPDLCALVTSWTLCPQNSQCINTLGSYSCVCKPGYYDVSSLVKPSVVHPVCNGKAALCPVISGGKERRLQVRIGGIFAACHHVYTLCSQTLRHLDLNI